MHQRKLLNQESKIVERWMRIKMVSLSNTLGMRIARPKLWLQERKRRKQIADTLEALKKSSFELEHSPYEASKVFVNIAFYILLAERDIHSVKVDALTHSDPWKRSIALRTIALTIYELDLDKLTGNKLKRAMESANVNNSLQTEAINSLRDIRKVKSKSRKILSPMRNAAIGHRDPNALVQYRAMRDLKPYETFELVAEFYDFAHRFYKVLPKLIHVAGGADGLLAQVSRKL